MLSLVHVQSSLRINRYRNDLLLPYVIGPQVLEQTTIAAAPSVHLWGMHDSL